MAPLDTVAASHLVKQAQLQQRIADLEARLARYEALIEQFPDGTIMAFDNDLRYTVAGGTSIAQFGMSRASVEGHTIWEVLPPETSSAVERLYRAALEGHSGSQEVLYEGHTFELRILPLHGPNGEIQAGMVVSMDVTARKRAEAAAQAANQQTATILEEMPDAFFRLDSEWRFTYVNHQAELLVERRAAELLGRNIWAEFPEMSGISFEQCYREAVETQRVVTFEQYYPPPLDRWLETRAVPAPDGLSIYFHDISERKQVELAAREQAELFQTVIDQMSDGVIVAEPDGRFAIFNNTSQQLFGPNADTGSDEWSAQYGLFLPDQQTVFPPQELPLARALAGEESRDVEIFVRHSYAPQGLWVTVNGRPLYDSQGRVRGGLVVCRDETERRRNAAEQALLQETIIRMQSATLRELSTPLIPISDQVMVMPLIGSVDSHRAEQVTETLLDGIIKNRARVAILDITGVPVVDTQVANALLRSAQSAKLLGARVVLTGIRPEVAQTLVGLGVRLDGIITRSTLQSGIAYAMGNLMF